LAYTVVWSWSAFAGIVIDMLSAILKRSSTRRESLSVARFVVSWVVGSHRSTSRGDRPGVAN
jgi:hypothetical protein